MCVKIINIDWYEKCYLLCLDIILVKFEANREVKIKAFWKFWSYEWMMHLYSALLYIVVHQKRFTIMGGGVSTQPPPMCSIHLDDATAATGQRHQCATGGEERESRSQSSVCSYHTPATGGEERESWSQSSVCSYHTINRWRGERVIEPIKWMRSPHTSNRWRGERVKEPIKCMCSPHPIYRWRGERVIEPIKCMRSPHPSYRWRGESHRANQVYALTTQSTGGEERKT